MKTAFYCMLLALHLGCVPIDAETGTSGTSSSDATDDGEATASGDGTETEAEAEAGSTMAGSTEAETASASDDGPVELACDDESDCKLHSDCCDCLAIHVDESPSSCDMSCDRNACERWGVTELLCAHTCHIRLLECDPAMVTCAASAPKCDDGLVPGVDERCWSGFCVPQELCRP